MADAPQGQGARRRQVSVSDVLAGWRANHGEVAAGSLRRLLGQPLSSLMSWLVIGIALALPACLYVGLLNLQALGHAWDSSARISMYLKIDVPDDRGRVLSESLRHEAGVTAVRYTDRAAALEEFRTMSGLGDLLEGMQDNPLPAVISIEPVSGLPAEQIAALQQRLAQMPEADSVKLDMEWVQRLYALVRLGQRMAMTIGGLLALGVVLVIGNTIRMAIENRRDEIVVTKLVGGTDAFVRRPFLYTGFWYGLGGGLAAWLIVIASLWWLRGPVMNLAGLYHSEFTLVGLGFGPTLLLWLGGACLGLGGAWIAVARHLGEIEPR